MWTAGQPHQPPGPHTYPGAAGPYPTAQPRSPYPGGPAPAGGNPATAVISAILALLVTIHHGLHLYMMITSDLGPGSSSPRATVAGRCFWRYCPSSAW